MANTGVVNVSTVVGNKVTVSTKAHTHTKTIEKKAHCSERAPSPPSLAGLKRNRELHMANTGFVNLSTVVGNKGTVSTKKNKKTVEDNSRCSE